MSGFREEPSRSRQKERGDEAKELDPTAATRSLHECRRRVGISVITSRRGPSDDRTSSRVEIAELVRAMTLPFHRVLASPAAVAPFCILRAHLLAPRLPHALVYLLLRKRFPMMLSWGIDWSPTDLRCGSCSLFLRCLPRYWALAIQPV